MHFVVGFGKLVEIMNMVNIVFTPCRLGGARNPSGRHKDIVNFLRNKFLGTSLSRKLIFVRSQILASPRAHCPDLQGVSVRGQRVHEMTMDLAWR